MRRGGLGGSRTRVGGSAWSTSIASVRGLGRIYECFGDVKALRRRIAVGEECVVTLLLWHWHYALVKQPSCSLDVLTHLEC